MLGWWMVSLWACGQAPQAEAPAPEPVPAPTAEAPPPAPAAAGTREDVDVDALAAALEAGAPLIDVRTPEEFAEGHVPGAVNLPLGSWEPGDEALQAYDKGEPLYVICRSGGRSSRAADQLATAGYHAVNVEGGTMAWATGGRPTAK